MAALGTVGAVFEAGVPRWLAGMGGVRNVVRQELVARQLRRHLPPADGERPVSVVDVGCGQGTQAIRLAARGYQVDGIDPSVELLAHARRAGGRESDPVRQRLRWEQAGLADHAIDHAGSYDAVCCHGVVMYLPSLTEAVGGLTRMARPGGLISILSRNQAGVAMRAGMTGLWGKVLDSFETDRYTNRLGLTDVRADRPEEVEAALPSAGADVVAWYGVRLFSDHWGEDDVPSDLEELLAAEEQAGERDPFRRLAALTHTLAVRRT